MGVIALAFVEALLFKNIKACEEWEGTVLEKHQNCPDGSEWIIIDWRAWRGLDINLYDDDGEVQWTHEIRISAGECSCVITEQYASFIWNDENFPFAVNRSSLFLSIRVFPCNVLLPFLFRSFSQIYIDIEGDLPIVIKFWMSNSLFKTKQEIILTKCCANNSFQTIKHCNWLIETHYFRAPLSLLREFFTKIHFRWVEK